MSSPPPDLVPSIAQGAGARLTLMDGTTRRELAWSEIGALDTSHIGLVFGAGGATGAAFEAGLLLALHIDHGIDVGSVDALLGTSAGAIGAALVALGFSPADIAALVAGAHRWLSSAASALEARFDPAVPELTFRGLVRRPGPMGGVRIASHLVRRRFVAAAMELLRDGEFDLTPQLSFLSGRDWPNAGLRVCAVDHSSGRRAVIDRASGWRLDEAVLASCAIPGVMRPVSVGGRRFIDGGAVSPTHLDLLAGQEHPDLIIALSPMSGAGARTAPGRLTAMHATRCLRRELRCFGRRQRVLLIEPAGELASWVLGESASRKASSDVLASSFLAASR